MKTPAPKVRAGCYCRISSDPDDKREGTARQREDTAALCEVQGWTIAGVYADDNRSASNGKDRPEWKRLLADIEAGKIDAIAAWDQDRNWRMMSELEELRRFFASLGREIKLATTGQGEIDLYSPTGVMMAQIKTAVSEHEIAMMKVRMRRAAKAKAGAGRPQWRKAFGYMCAADGPIPDPVTAPLVAQAYASVIAGGSISDIARDWNAQGHIGLTGKPWSPSTVSLFLRAPRNAGLRAHNNVIVGNGTWEPLVSEATWRAAQSVMTAPGRSRPKTVRRHLLTGLLACGKNGCGGALAACRTSVATGNAPGRPKAGESKPPKHREYRMVYRCKTCFGVAVPANHIEEFARDLVAARLAKPDAVDLLKTEIHDAAEAERLRTEANTLLTRLDEIADERADGLLTGPQARRATERIEAHLAEIDRQQQDSDRLRVFDRLPLGTPEVAAAVDALTADRFRAVLAVLATVTIEPCGRGKRRLVDGGLDTDLITVAWKE